MTDTYFDEHDISELRDYRELNMALMTGQPIWPNGWCQNVAIVAYTIKTEREQARAQDNRCVELLEAAKIFGALLQPLHDEHKDHHPIYGINSVTITAGDLRRLTKAIAAFEASHEK